MKLFKSLLTFLLSVLFLLATSATALAVEAWTTDPATGGKICIVFWDDTKTLVSANWSGATVAGMAEGQGNLQFTYKDEAGKGIKAQGDVEMKSGKLDGHASIKYSLGDSFDGSYREGQREGKGILKFASGDVYDGEWKANQYDGRGIYKFASGDVYDGEWKAGKYDGRGILKLASGNVYNGDFKVGQYDGIGIYKFVSGDVYDGEFKAGQYDGRGILKLAASGGVYDGEFKANQYDGRGIYKFASGDVYDGEWKAGQYDGRGILKLASGDVYEGDFKVGQYDGRGVYKFADGRFYDGEWKANKYDGKGIQKFTDGKVYEGEYKNGMPDGYGIGKDATGKVVHDGQWKNGEPVTDGQAGGISSGVALKADTVIGIPWGATDEQTKSIMKQRPKTQYIPQLNGKDNFDRWQYYYGSYADFPDAWIYVHFYQDKMWLVEISWPLKENEVLERFNTVKQGLIGRYGALKTEEGKYLDSFGLWDLGGEGRGYTATVSIKQNNIKITDADPSTQTHPFRVFVKYYNQTVADLYYSTLKSGSSGSKDY